MISEKSGYIVIRKNLVTRLSEKICEHGYRKRQSIWLSEILGKMVIKNIGQNGYQKYWVARFSEILVAWLKIGYQKHWVTWLSLIRNTEQRSFQKYWVALLLVILGCMVIRKIR